MPYQKFDVKYPQLNIGDKVPDAAVARLENGTPYPVSIASLTAGRNVMFVGMPGAFTPTCSGHHIPSLIASAPRLMSTGIAAIYCVTVNDPWVVERWASTFPADCGLTFLADGNGAFTERCGFMSDAPDLFLSRRSARYMMMVRDNVVFRLSVEPNLVDVTCTSGEAALAAN